MQWMAFRIAQISDTHLGAAKGYFVPNFRCVSRALAHERPDLVVNTGDISLDGTSEEADLAEARTLHEALGLPFKCIPGNHDVGDNAGVPRALQLIDGPRLDRYRKHFGDDWWCEDVPGWRLVGVNAQLLASTLDAAREQTRFVCDAAAGAGRQRIALFVHKPLLDASADEAEVGGRFLNPEPRRELLAALAASPPALIASGHVHQFRETRAGGAHHVWAPSTAYCIPDAQQPRYGVKEVGYVLHTLSEDGSHESRFVKAPGMQDLSIAEFPDAYRPVR